MSWFRKRLDFSGSHVLISGGSTGIGLALAREFVQLGAHVSIVARTQSKLDSALSELQDLGRVNERAPKLAAFSADVTDYTKVTEAVQRAENEVGEIDIAVCCAGAAYPGRFVDQNLELFEKSMSLDYFGSLHVVKAVLPRMLEKNAGRILLVASPLAAIGFVGYSTYCPAKFAVRGLADVLRNELAGTNVQVSLGYPLDTDTPGFANENLSKPPETEAISRFTGGEVYTAEKIAKSLVRGLSNGEYHIKTPEFIVNLLLSSMSSTTPPLYPLIVEILLAPVIVIILAIYRRILDWFVVKHGPKREVEKPKYRRRAPRNSAVTTWAFNLSHFFGAH